MLMFHCCLYDQLDHCLGFPILKPSCCFVMYVWPGKKGDDFYLSRLIGPMVSRAEFVWIWVVNL